MSTLRINLFGDVRAAFDGAPEELKLTQTTQTLLAYLVLKRHRTHPRSVVANLVWGDFPEERARSCLNTALWRLRNLLEPEGVARGTFITTTATGEVGFNPQSDHWIDVAAFEDVTTQCIRTTGATISDLGGEKVEHILQLYTGQVLESFYEEWALSERERIHSLYLDCLAFLMRYHESRRNFDLGIQHGRRLLQLAPVREEIHRHMMRLYAESGQVALAAQQFETCRDVLARELGISPMEETHALYESLTRRPEEPASPIVPIPDASPSTTHELTLEDGFLLLRQAMKALDQARGELQRTIELVERMSSAHGEARNQPALGSTREMGDTSDDEFRETAVIGR